MRAVAIACIVLASGIGTAQEYKPYPRARITVEQWQQYFSEVSDKHAGSRREFPAEHLVVFEDLTNYTTYAFTQPGHPAHPAWVTRHVLKDGRGVTVQQIGYFAGEEEPFATLFRAYQRLNAQMRQDIENPKGNHK